MKLHATDTTVQRGGTMVETQFTVRTTAKTFAILSSGLYSDKIAAPIRELCCNAYDAHVAAGNADLAFDVQLPTTFNPMFVVRDYGTGLSDEDVKSLYTTYFDSTKTNSDEMIGALGLGSKSPFAYTTSFSIESRHKGMKGMYAAFINEDGVPALATLIEPAPTDEPDGMTISFSVRTDDVHKFSKAAQRVLMYFPVRPNVTPEGWTPFSLSHSVEGSNWKLRTAQYESYMTGAYVIQGCVAYPLDASILRDNGLSEVGYSIASASLDLFVPIGDVEVAPSREALSYDHVTVRNLIAHMEVCVEEQQTSIQTAINDCPTMWAARRMVKDLSDSSNKMSNVFNLLNNKQVFTYNGQPIQAVIPVSLAGVQHTCITVVSQYSKYSRRVGNKTVTDLDTTEPISCQLHPVAIPQQQHTHVVICDTKAAVRPLLKEYAEKVRREKGKQAHFVALHPLDRKVGINQAEVDQLLIQLGSPEPVLISTVGLNVVAAAKTTYNKRAKGDRLKFVGFPERESRYAHKAFSRLTWMHETVDFELGGFYMPIHRFDVMYNGSSMLSLDSILLSLAHTGWIDDDEQERIYGFNEKDMADIKDDPNWVNLFDFIKEKLADYEPDEEVLVAMAYDRFANNNGIARFRDTWKRIGHTVRAGAFKEFFDVAGVIPPNIDEAAQVFGHARALGSYLYQPELNNLIETRHAELVDEWAAVQKQYPMLQHCNISDLRQHPGVLVDYINMCEDARNTTSPLALALAA